MLTGDDGSDKRTNEIGVAIPLLDQLGAGKVTADALLTQTAIASYLRKHRPLHVRGQGPRSSAQRHPAMVPRRRKTPSRLCPHDRQAHQRQAADRARTLGTARNLDALNDYLLFPGVGQAFVIRRTRCQVRKGRVTDTSVDTSWGVTSHTPHTADAQRLLRINRGHWTIENSLHRILDDSDNWNEDNSRIRTGHGPENMTGLRRFAIGVIKMHGKPVAATVRKLTAPHACCSTILSANTRPKPAIA